MDIAAAEELKLCWAAAKQEALVVSEGQRAYNAEALQRVLWRHRDSLLGLVLDADVIISRRQQIRDTLAPFARAATVMPEGRNPVLVSLASLGGRDFIQLRPADFRRARDLREALE